MLALLRARCSREDTRGLATASPGRSRAWEREWWWCQRIIIIIIVVVFNRCLWPCWLAQRVVGCWPLFVLVLVLALVLVLVLVLASVAVPPPRTRTHVTSNLDRRSNRNEFLSRCVVCFGSDMRQQPAN